MKRRLRTTARRTLGTIFRGVAAVAVAAKLLVPVGFMPAALADGGPITLCNAGPAAMLTELAAASTHEPASGHADHGPDSGDAADHDHGTPGHDDTSSSHHDWERCSLGGLASLAAIASHWDFAVEPLPAARIAVADVTAVGRRTVVPFRSRAPPLTHA